MTDDVNKTDVGFSCRQAVPNDWEFVQYLLLEICKLHASFRPDIFRDGGLKYDAESFAALTACPDTPVFICENSHGDRVGYIFLCLRTVSTQRCGEFYGLVCRRICRKIRVRSCRTELLVR